jgi:hypothetical protein
MRFATVADIHGNALALEAVIEDLQREKINQVVNLGDVLSGPMDPAGVAERIIPLNWQTVRGNHDRYLIEQDPADMGPTDAVTHAALSVAHLDWVRTLPTNLNPFAGVYACHATPRADDTYWMERVLPDGTVRQATRRNWKRRSMALRRVPTSSYAATRTFRAWPGSLRARCW